MANPDSNQPDKSKCEPAAGISRSWKEHGSRLRKEVLVIWFVLLDRRSPWYARFVAGCAAAYMLSPVQLVPSFIPVIGLADDVFVASIAIAFIRRTTAEWIIREARERAESPGQRGQNLRPHATRIVTTALLATIWFAVTVWMIVIKVR